MEPVQLPSALICHAVPWPRRPPPVGMVKGMPTSTVGAGAFLGGGHGVCEDRRIKVPGAAAQSGWSGPAVGCTSKDEAGPAPAAYAAGAPASARISTAASSVRYRAIEAWS